MDAQEALQALKLFNEKADKLERLSFTQKIFGERSGVTIHYKQGVGAWSELHGPDEESREAMLLTLRFFVQDNEQSSLRNMADAYDALPVDPTLPSQFHDIRKQVNEFLDSKTPIAIAHPTHGFAAGAAWVGEGGIGAGGIAGEFCSGAGGGSG